MTTRKRKTAAATTETTATTTRREATATAKSGDTSTPLRQCRKCGKRRRASSFYHNAALADGLTPWCRDCLCAYYTARRDARREANR